MAHLITDVQENVQRFNHEEALWQSFTQRRSLRRRLQRLLRSFGAPLPLTEKQLDRIDWLAAERETHRSDCIGKESP